MSSNIVSNELPENIAKDLTVNEHGQIFVSRRGTARLSGVTQTAIQKIIAKIEGDNQTAPKIFESFVGQSFQGDNLPDIFVSAIKTPLCLGTQRLQPWEEKRASGFNRSPLEWV